MVETIAAISTALANGAISIIKLSGPDAIEIVSKIYKGKNLFKVKSHTIHYGHIVDKTRVIDEVLVSVFRAPKTFTMEDVVEINCHGGIFVTNQILELLLLNGAILAEPGEFTKRAFLNGRIDLTQAEAVMDIIESQTNYSLNMANHGLLGETRDLIQRFRNRVLECIAQIEVNIDYPEYYDELQVTNEILKPILESLLVDINKVLEKTEISKILRSGIKTAIIGKPNVGKSSLLNRLLREEKAIVTDIAGTTRDTIEGSINIGGIVLNLIDTAGVRKTEDVVEQIGVERSKKVLNDAELVLLVFDYSERLSAIDLELLNITKNKSRIIIVNKSDLNKKIELEKLDDYLLITSFEIEDIHRLESKIKEVCNISNITSIDATYIGNSRQVAKLKQAREFIISAIESITMGQPVDIVNIDIHNAWVALGEILGEVNSEDLINELFSKFCLGK